MAEIPVQKRSGGLGWLWIVLALLVLALLAWWLLGSRNDDVVENPDTAAQVAPVETATATTPLVVGQPVNLENQEVGELAGDMSFYIDVDGQRVPVFFDEVPTPGTPTEGKLDINPGMRVNITGEVRDATSTLPEGADPSILGDSQNYIFATNINPVQ